MNDPGWTRQSSVQRYTANVNAFYHLSKKFELNLIGNAAYRKQKAPGTLGSGIDVVSGEVKRDFDINPYSYALNTSRTLEYYVRNYAPFNITNELVNNYMDLNVLDSKFQAELKYRPISKVELAVLGAYKYSTTTQSHYIKDYSIRHGRTVQWMMRRCVTLIRGFIQTRIKANSLPVSVLPVGGFFKETKYSMNSWDFRATGKLQ